jgi:hypothetical protein
MRLYNLKGRLVTKNVSPYRIDWGAPSRSKIQFKVKQFLKPYWLSHICYEEFPVYGSKMKVDILNATRRIAVEVQGRQHDNYVPFFFKTRTDYWKSIKRDDTKLKWLEQNSFTLIEIKENEIDLLSEEFIKEKFGVLL